MCYKLFGEQHSSSSAWLLPHLIFINFQREKPKKNLHKSSIYICLCVCVCRSACERPCVCVILTNLCWRFVICFSRTLPRRWLCNPYNPPAVHPRSSTPHPYAPASFSPPAPPLILLLLLIVLCAKICVFCRVRCAAASRPKHVSCLPRPHLHSSYC